MNILWEMPAVVLTVIAWLTAPPAGLADIAQREALRRAATPKAQASLSNAGLPVVDVPASAVTIAAPPDSTGAAGSDETTKPETESKPETGAAKPEPGRDEKWWRSRMDELRATLDKDQLSADAMQTRINVLQADSVNIDDPIKQTKARMDLIRAIDELDKIRKALEADRKAIADLQSEARRLSVPPGWIR